MKNGVTIYGGFPASGDPDMDDRDWTTYETILSGDIGTTDDNSDNCYHVFYHPTGLGLDNTAILDGFIVTAGNANGTTPHFQGGGMYNSSSSPTIINCVFSSNSAFWDGAGMYNTGSSPTLSNCSFISNNSQRGGGIYNLFSSPAIGNSTFTSNSADWGGGIFNAGSSPTINNSTFSNNSAGLFGGGMYNIPSFGTPASPTINNSIIWGNSANNNGNQFYIEGGTTTLNFSCYANGPNDIFLDGGTLTAEPTNNITNNPLFVGSGDHPYSLQPTSPCIDAGDDDLVPGGINTDIIGNPRIRGASVDMGAYESEFYTLDVSITPNTKTDICYDSPVVLVAEIDDVTVVGAVAPLTYSWSPTFLVEHTDPSSPVATLTRAIRDAVYTLTVTDVNGMQGTATVSVEVLAGNVITAPGTIVHSFRAEDITEPLNLFALALGEDYEEVYDDYDLEFECRLGWLPPGETDCTGFNATAYIPLPNSRLYGWIIIKHSGGCEADRRRINIVVRGNELDYIPD